jgi:hypothetical protein
MARRNSSSPSTVLGSCRAKASQASYSDGGSSQGQKGQKEAKAIEPCAPGQSPEDADYHGGMGQEELESLYARIARVIAALVNAEDKSDRELLAAKLRELMESLRSHSGSSGEPP